MSGYWSRRLCALSICTLCSLLNSCAVSTKPLELDEHLANINQQLSTIKANRLELNGPLTLNHAIALALKHNLNFQTAALRRVLLYEELDQTRQQFLPLAISRSRYTGRNNHSGSVRNNGVITTAQSQDAAYSTSQLNISWDLLNFGISYANAQQISNQLLIEKENQRLATQSLVAQVKHQYWQALAADQLRISSAKLKKQINALETSTNNGNISKGKKTGSLLQLANISLEINQQETEAYLKKTQFKQLLNIPVEQSVQLVEVNFDARLSAGQYNQLKLAQLEKQALIYRPELRIASYQKRIKNLTLRKQFLDKLPNLKFLYDYNWDSSSKISNPSWSQWGIEITQNLLALIPPLRRQKSNVVETTSELEELRDLSLTLAVLSQVHLDYYQLGLAQQHYAVTTKLARHHQTTMGTAKSNNIKASKNPNRLSTIKQQWQHIKLQKQKRLSYGELQLLTARLFTDIGGAPLIHEDTSLDASALALAVRDPIDALLQAQKNTLTLQHELIILNEEMPTVAQRKSPIAPKKPTLFFTIQLVQSNNSLNLQQLLNVSQAPDGVYSLRSVTGGSQFALTYGSYPDYSSAQSALKSVPFEMQHYQPWIRSLSEYQNTLK